MTDSKPTTGDQPYDLAQVALDDALLDALGRGEPAGDDQMAAMLSAWRADLDADPPAETAAFEGVVAASPRAGRRPAAWLKRVAVGVAAAVVILGGAGLLAGRAGPDSPLWPVSRLLYPEQSDVRAVEYAIAQARQAAGAGRYDDARRLLDEATAGLDRIADPAAVRRLRDEIDQVRRTLPGAVPPVTSPSGGPPPTPPASPGPGGVGGTPGRPPGGAPAPPAPGGPLPGLPPVPLPVPVPSAPLPPPPNLPLPSLPGLPLTPLPSLPGLPLSG
jgi:Anti-sigma-D factor RsdA to sigma factor binding region